MPYLKFWKTLCSFVLLVLSCALNASAETTWTEVRSPHFRVLTDGSAQQGQNAASHFEQMRFVFATEFEDRNIGAGAPLTIIAVRDKATFATLEPSVWKATSGNVAGEFHRGWEKQFATVILDSFQQSEIVVFHEYTHSVLHARAHWLPMWLDEGFAEFYAYTRFEKNRTLVGAPSIRSMALRQSFILPISEMLDTKRSSQLLRDSTKANLFYAEAWAMVHYMMYGPEMGGGAKLNAFFQKLQVGVPQTDAFQQVFGDMHRFEKSFSMYVQGFSFQVSVLPADEKIDPKSFSSRKLTTAETEYELGSFQIGAHEAPGRARIEKALELDPKLAGAHEELAFLEFRKGRDAEAVKEWQQAVAVDPARPRSEFALAMTAAPLHTQSRTQLLNTQKELRHVTDLSPNFAAPYVELGLVEWRLGQLQKAYEDVRKAEQLEPWRAGYHVLKGWLLLAGHQPAEAAKAATFVAQRWDGPDHNEAVDLWNEIPMSSRVTDVSPVYDFPKDVTVVRGTLTELTCGEGPNQPTVVTLTPDISGATPLTFKTDGRFIVGFSDSFWWGEDHFTMCHHLTGHPALVAYKREGTRLLDLEVRDDLPTSARQEAVASAH